MDKKKLQAFYERLQKQGLTPEEDKKIRFELEGDLDHGPPPGQTQDQAAANTLFHPLGPLKIYQFQDLAMLQAITRMEPSYTARIKSLDELLEHDQQREADGFPRKIRVGRMVKPGRGATDKVVVVPTTVEEKFIHDSSFDPQEEEESAGGTGEGEEGEVIGEQPVREEEGQGESGPGQGEGAVHEVESSAYDLGRILTEQFQLPNLKEKGKKRSLSKYTYDLTDKNRGFGQVLDKKSTLRRILQTNINLGRITGDVVPDPTEFLISPGDRIYRILSPEKDFESQAMIFFVRDYSGSMGGKPTEMVVTQHVLIYSWLLYQYEKQVETRFILHDTEAKEVEDFYTYYNSKVAGGTQVSSAYRLVNTIVEQEDLASDYNIYIFHGTDGDDWDKEGKEAIPELKKMLTYANRVGITVAENVFGRSGNSEVERYITGSGLLEEEPSLIRMDVLQHDAEESRLIDGIKKLISE